jgi:hypothetical protein
VQKAKECLVLSVFFGGYYNIRVPKIPMKAFLRQTILVNKKLKYSVPNSTFKSDWDIAEAIIQTLQATSLQVEFEHVQGHQDNQVPVGDLNLLAQLNVEAD